jgi:Raf kinase inhibitor-like YbhB/YbcL family protein
MTLTTTAWRDGGVIADRHAQRGEEVSPPLAWGEAPEGTASFVLHVYNANAVAGAQLEGQLHWLVWNIPGSARGLPEGVSHGPQLPDGMRQISVSGPYYRGPAATATGPVNHYVFELFALDTLITVEPVGQSPAATRTAVMQAMSGRVRGKAIMFGLFGGGG